MRDAPMTRGEHFVKADRYLQLADAATLTAEADLLLRTALVHATLANVEHGAWLDASEAQAMAKESGR